MRQISISLVCLLLLVGCEKPAPIQGDVIQSKSSPNGDVTALLTQDDSCGATCSYIDRVYIQQKDRSDVLGIFRADHVKDIHIEWLKDGSLDIRMSCGHIFDFSNFFYVLDANGNLLRTVTIKLEDGGPTC